MNSLMNYLSIKTWLQRTIVWLILYLVYAKLVFIFILNLFEFIIFKNLIKGIYENQHILRFGLDRVVFRLDF